MIESGRTRIDTAPATSLWDVIATHRRVAVTSQQCDRWTHGEPPSRLSAYLTLTACWNVGRFWNGYTLGAVTPAVTRARLAFQHEGWGSVAQAPDP